MSRRSLKPAAVAALAALAAACLIVPSGAAAGAAAAPAAGTAWDAGLPTVSIVTNGWVDVREILRSVAANASLGLQIAPDVDGTVNVHLENVKVGRALDALLGPVNLGYQVEDGVLMVHKRGLVTRWFQFDYPVTMREGRGELEISVNREQMSGGSGSSGGGGSGESSGENQNKSHVTSTATMSIWPEVMKSLRVVVFQDPLATPASGGGAQEQSLSYADADGRSLVVNPMAGLIQVTAEWDRVDHVATLLEHLQSSLQRQVAIEVRIMEVVLDRETQTGINWETLLDGDFQAGLVTIPSGTNIADNYLQFKVDSKHVTGVMQAISTNGDLHMVSTPRVTTLNNQKAIVRVVREDVYYLADVQPAVISNGVATDPVISYTPQTVPVGVVLDVTPQIGRDGLITLNVHPTISDVVGIAESPNQDSAPILSVRELDTVGKVRNGETLIIAGLISERERSVRSGVPLLKDLPLLGLLFSQTSRETYNVELVMLLTPVMMEGSEADAVADAAREAMEGRM